jgi:hypothetical protein
MKCVQAGSELKNNVGLNLKNKSVREMYDNQVEHSTNAMEGRLKKNLDHFQFAQIILTRKSECHQLHKKDGQPYQQKKGKR